MCCNRSRNTLFTGTGACAYQSPDESSPYEQVSDYDDDDDDRDWCGEISGSDDGHLSDSTEAPEQTEEMSGQCTFIWVGIIFPLLKQTTLNLTSLTIPGREETPGNLRGCQLLCHWTTSYARNWKDLI